MPPPNVIIIEQPWLRVGCTIGEGPLYDASTSILHFVDIDERKVFHVNTLNKEVTSELYPESVTCLALRTRGHGLACAAARGFGLLEDGPSITYLGSPIAPQESPLTRMNDGACDSKGRFFAGTIENRDANVPGRLFKYDPISQICCIVDEGPFTDSNGIGWSPDEKTMYFTDSLVNKIYAYDYNDGELSNRRVFVNALEKGYPEETYCDGLCVDTEGGVWSARWGGSCISRFTCDGELDLEIRFPTAINVTCCCFGGPNNDQLYVTTAHCKAFKGDPVRQKEYIHSGDLFHVDLSGLYRGLPRYPFTG